MKHLSQYLKKEAGRYARSVILKGIQKISKNPFVVYDSNFSILEEPVIFNLKIMSYNLDRINFTTKHNWKKDIAGKTKSKILF
jgi:hypothetical protein